MHFHDISDLSSCGVEKDEINVKSIENAIPVYPYLIIENTSSKWNPYFSYKPQYIWKKKKKGDL